MTRLQKAASRSKLCKRLSAEFMIAEEIPLKGFRRLVNGVFREHLRNMPDPEIKRILFEILLHCCDASADDRAEALMLLRKADTALTVEQLEALNHHLSDMGNYHGEQSELEAV